MKNAADVLNAMDRNLSDPLLSELERRNPELGQAMRQKMFTFEDLLTLDRAALQKIMREVDMRDLAVALKSASAKLKETLLGCISKRAAETVKEEISFLGSIKKRDIEAAQMRRHGQACAGWRARAKSRSHRRRRRTRMNPWSETRHVAQTVARAPPAKRGGGRGRRRAATEEELRASYQRGRRDGRESVERATAPATRRVARIDARRAGVACARPSRRSCATPRTCMVSLALAVAQKLVADMPISAAMVEAAVRDALAQVEGTAQFTVRLHPADLELLQKAGSPLLALGDGAKDFRFLSSPEVTRGGCLVQTHFGTVDARRETKFDLLKRNLLA